jgi:starch synthase
VKIAFVTPELQSLVRRTNLAEISESLPRTLRQQGHDVRVFLPFSVDLETDPLADLHSIGKVEVPDGQQRKISLEVHTALLGDLPVVFIDHPAYFRSRHPYGDQEGPYPDNWHRFAIFARGVLESLELLKFHPDIVHCLDWTSGLIPIIRELEYVTKKPEHPASKAGTFFGVHNLAMQGSFEREILPLVGLPHKIFKEVNGIELGGKVNFLKAGAEFGTIVGTHSPSHAKRIQERDRGYGLEETFKRRSKELVGITNGIDYRAWDPSRDTLLAQPFGADDKTLNGKKRCKAALQSSLGLNSGPRTPVIAVIGRLDADAGFDILAEVMVPILERNVEIAIMGSGRSDIIERLRTMESTFEGRCRLIEGYNTNTAHVMLGGADMMILPSHYHPSNTLCAIAMRYGVVPLIYSKSGLEDTVIDESKNEGKGTGFMFNQYTGDSLVEGIDEARKIYRDAAAWKELCTRCLEQDFSWQSTAANYLKAYRRVTRRIKTKA